MKIRVADYIAAFLAKRGLDTLFTIVGGGAMHLNDAFGKHPALTCVYQHNEQACGMSAEGYTRVSGKTGIVCVTTGPGGTNAVSGVLGAWLDSIPMLVISGQVKYETTVRGSGLPLRQMGDQEFDITGCVGTMTKYAVMVYEPENVRYHLEKALYLAEHGRPGPCWLDIPMNVQAAMIETDGLRVFCPDELTHKTVNMMALAGIPAEGEQIDALKEKARLVLKKIEQAERPVIYFGNGVHLAHAEDDLIRMAESLGIPVVAGFNAHDVLPWEHGLYIGRPGTIGDRAGNYAVQNADLLLIIGCRLNIRQTGYDWKSFAREAYQIMVDIDAAEMEKPNLRIAEKIEADAGAFIRAVNEQMVKKSEQDERQEEGLRRDQAGHAEQKAAHKTWLDWCLARKRKYPVVLPEYWNDDKGINPYCFMETLGEQLREGDVVAAANATACICSFQALKVKKGQRIFSNSGSASMGYDLPAAIGAAEAMRGKEGRVICLAGDGSIQMNIQELQTIVTGRYPIKIFVLNNNGYHSIRQTQANFFGEPLVGCEPASGVAFPDLEKLAVAYGLPYRQAARHRHMRERIDAVLQAEGPCVCEVILDAAQPFAPKPSSVRMEDGSMVSQPLENMAPFLSREEFLSNMLIAPLA